MAEKRYQVFLSGTYRDLQRERQAVLEALLTVGNAIPTTMEWFGASDSDVNEYIQRIVEETDYVVLIVGWRYGSVDSHGISYTEREFSYAIQHKKPLIAFLRRGRDGLAADQLPVNDDERKKVEDFRAKVEDARLADYFDDPHHLAARVIPSFSKLVRTREAVGWVRADELKTANLAEVNALLRERDELRIQLAACEAALSRAGGMMASPRPLSEVDYAILATVLVGGAHGSPPETSRITAAVVHLGYKEGDVIYAAASLCHAMLMSTRIWNTNGPFDEYVYELTDLGASEALKAGEHVESVYNRVLEALRVP